MINAAVIEDRRGSRMELTVGSPAFLRQCYFRDFREAAIVIYVCQANFQPALSPPAFILRQA